MALYNCPNCGSTISDTAKHCPKCGVQLKEDTINKKNKISLYALLAVLGVLVLIVGGTIVYSDYSEKKAIEEARIQEELAKAAEIQRRDSLDQVLWKKTIEKNDEEAYARYLREFPNGKNSEFAKKYLDYAQKLKLTDEEQYEVSNVIRSFFNSIAYEYEDNMISHLNPTIDSFLGKKNATKVDVITYMRKLHSGDVYSIQIMMGDIIVEKSLDGQQEPTYTAAFTYDQRIEREDTSLETFASLKGNATLNRNFKITSLSLSKTAKY